ncbi:hypothetical protein Sjap_017268 [Stephania japonica]|uniref:Uncharacterized protein n=1 Tax=Stephania japonica TaxID=461633 RepID=A0AAP0NJ84_9MAGN
MQCTNAKWEFKCIIIGKQYLVYGLAIHCHHPYANMGNFSMQSFVCFTIGFILKQ